MFQFKFRLISPRLIASGKCQGEACGTECVILQEDGSTLGVGQAYLHPRDNFARPLGRKVAAGKAIKAGIVRLGTRDHVGAEKRREVWLQLFEKSPKTFRDSKGGYIQGV